MVHEYNTRASNQGLSPQEMSAICGDLLTHTPSPSLAAMEYFNFDLAVVGLGFHHFADPSHAAKRLVERLKPGTGILLIIDFMPHTPIPYGQHQFHGAEHVVMHHGFAEEETKLIFEGAGCVDVDVAVLGKGATMGEGEAKFERSVFLARGRRA
jgi:SAM-dependent methyltransferase